MPIRVAVNGFGRIGRLVVRAARRRAKDAVNFVAVNDLTDAATLAHLFRYDSIHGHWPEPVVVEGQDLRVGDDHIRVLAEPDPTRLPWRELGADIVLECTGRFTDREQAKVHLERGARVVVISAPAKNADCTFVPGVNADSYKKGEHRVVSIGSCTTNSLAPALFVLHQRFQVERGLMTTIHAYTNDQRILDFPHRDLRRARAAAVSLIPTSTGAARAIGLVLPELAGKLDGIAVRAPLPCGSLTDLTCVVRHPADRDSVNAAFREAAEGRLSGILEYCTDPIVSADVVGNPHSAIFDAALTHVMGGTLVKVFCWYDNEWGFSNRLAELLSSL
jgi:glyceraldehyde 3-phosphate dehydrogenase